MRLLGKPHSCKQYGEVAHAAVMSGVYAKGTLIRLRGIYIASCFTQQQPKVVPGICRVWRKLGRSTCCIQRQMRELQLQAQTGNRSPQRSIGLAALNERFECCQRSLIMTA